MQNDYRKVDELIENRFREIMQPIYEHEGIFSRYNDDRALDIAGFDVELIIKGERVMVDEKMFASQMNSYEDCHTYAFETKTINNPNEMGWFLSDEKCNTHVALIFPKFTKVDRSDIESIEVLVVNEEKIKQYLTNLGLIKETPEKSKDYITMLIDKNGHEYGKEGKIKIGYQFNRDVKLVRSTHLTEKPENIIINRNVLRELADKVVNIKDVHKEVDMRLLERVPIKNFKHTERKDRNKHIDEKPLTYSLGDILKRAQEEFDKQQANKDENKDKNKSKTAQPCH